MNKNFNNKRREFIKKSVLASSIFIVPRHVLGGSGFISPSDRLNIAAIASGGKGGRGYFKCLCKWKRKHYCTL